MDPDPVRKTRYGSSDQLPSSSNVTAATQMSVETELRSIHSFNFHVNFLPLQRLYFIVVASHFDQENIMETHE